jgi:trehalose-phosphatase
MTSAIDAAFDACRDALDQRPGGLFSDFDGTLSYIARTPGEASLAEGAAAALASLARHLAVVGIITGRSAADARARVGIDGLTIVGNHGLERLDDSGLTINQAASEQVAQIGHALETIREEIAGTTLAEGLVFENKVLSGSIHYRLAANHLQARETLVSLAHREAARGGLLVTEGKLVVELRPTVAVNKGSALRDIASNLALRGCVMFGDDITDVDAFLAIKELAGTGVEGVAVAVITQDTAPLVLESADFMLQGVGECVGLLRMLADHYDG